LPLPPPDVVVAIVFVLIVGSIANIIVVDQAARLGVTIDWRTHARVGMPVTIGTLAVAIAWLWVRG
jgi:Na+/H+ antiporter NhaD/arsenite permease-like protein